MVQLRNYQIRAINQLYEAIRQGNRRLLWVLPTGAGKSTVASYFVRKCTEKEKRVLFFVHSTELVEQFADRLRNQFHVLSGIIMAGSKQDRSKLVQVASVQTLARREMPEADVVIIDECFTAGTLVDGIEIEKLKTGCFVNSFNHDLGIIEKKKVLSIFKSRPKKLLVLNLSNNESITCTTNHPFFVPSIQKYVPAIDLRGELILKFNYEKEIPDNTKNLLHLFNSICTEKLEFNNEPILFGCVQEHCKRIKVESSHNALQNVRNGNCMQGEKWFAKGKEWAFLLFRNLQERVFKRNIRKINGRHEQEICVCKNEKMQPYEIGIRKGKGVEKIKRNELETESAGRQRQGADIARANDSGCAWMECKCNRKNNEVKRAGIPLSLQNRCWERRKENSDRDRWNVTQSIENKGEGFKKAESFESVRVESIEVYEQRDSGRFGELCTGGYVYNIEVEDNNNYFANGILVHNCHRSQAATYKKIIGSYPKAVIVGLTATPYRGDGKGLGDLFETIVHPVKIRELIELGHLVGTKVYVPKEHVDMTGVKTIAGDYDKKEMSKRFQDVGIVRGCVDNYRKYANGKRAIVFNCSVEHSKEVDEMFKRAGIPSAHLDGETPKDERKKIVNGFRDGRILVLNNCFLFTEGFDVPACDAVILNRATKSEGLFVQMVGRGLRPAAGKEYCTVIDHSDNTMRFGFVEDYDLMAFSLEDRKKKKEGNEIPKTKQCKNCLSLVPFFQRVCSCGYEFPRKERKVTFGDEQEFVVLERDAVIVERLQRLTYGKAKNLPLSQLRLYALLHKYKRGWWFHKAIDEHGLPIIKEHPDAFRQVTFHLQMAEIQDGTHDLYNTLKKIANV